jgi:hypothetical protein
MSNKESRAFKNRQLLSKDLKADRESAIDEERKNLRNVMGRPGCAILADPTARDGIVLTLGSASPCFPSTSPKPSASAKLYPQSQIAQSIELSMFGNLRMPEADDKRKLHDHLVFDGVFSAQPSR